MKEIIYKPVQYNSCYDGDKKVEKLGFLTYPYDSCFCGCDAPDYIMFVPKGYDINSIHVDSKYPEAFEGTLEECKKKYPPAQSWIKYQEELKDRLKVISNLEEDLLKVIENDRKYYKTTKHEERLALNSIFNKYYKREIK